MVGGCDVLTVPARVMLVVAATTPNWFTISPTRVMLPRVAFISALTSFGIRDRAGPGLRRY